MYLRTVRGETRIPSLSSSSFAIRSSPHNGFSVAILRIRLRSSSGIGGRPALHFQRQKIRQPSRCHRTTVDGLTLTTASRQSKSLENTAKLTRVAWSTRRGLIPRSIYRASCLRRTRFSARIALDERKNKTTSLKTSKATPTIARTRCNMRSSCQSRPAFQAPGQPAARIIADHTHRKGSGTVAKNCFMRRRNDNERRTARRPH